GWCRAQQPRGCVSESSAGGVPGGVLGEKRAFEKPIRNPFALMMDPDAIFAALASSDRLARLQSRVWRPLDKPLIALADEEAAAFDAELELAPEAEETET
ncbi:MAG: hypothetical protein LH479_00040, partial [Polaromonas sp.]|nr:hypothetical protein [Polaromonas sp.]